MARTFGFEEQSLQGSILLSLHLGARPTVEVDWFCAASGRRFTMGLSCSCSYCKQGTDCPLSRTTFPRMTYSEQPWEAETMSPSRAKLRFVYSFETDTASSSTAKGRHAYRSLQKIRVSYTLKLRVPPCVKTHCVYRGRPRLLAVALWDLGLGELAQKMLMLWLGQWP